MYILLDLTLEFKKMLNSIEFVYSFEYITN